LEGTVEIERESFMDIPAKKRNFILAYGAIVLSLAFFGTGCVSRKTLRKVEWDAYARGRESGHIEMESIIDDYRAKKEALLAKFQDSESERDRLAHQIETFLRIGCRCKHKTVFDGEDRGDSTR
jgi:hypothetical protein